MIEISSLTNREAEAATKESKYGFVWKPGLYVIDDQRVILENREEVMEVIAQLLREMERLWSFKADTSSLDSPTTDSHPSSLMSD